MLEPAVGDGFYMSSCFRIGRARGSSALERRCAELLVRQGRTTANSAI